MGLLLPVLSGRFNALHNFDVYFTRKRTQIHGKFLVSIFPENRGKIGAYIAQNPTHCIKKVSITLILVWRSLADNTEPDHL